MISSEIIFANSLSFKFIYKPLVLNNITNWGVFDDDAQIINFFHIEYTFRDLDVDESQHEQDFIDSSLEDHKVLENTIPRSVVRLEKH